jgi:hypothetical protein
MKIKQRGDGECKSAFIIIALVLSLMLWLKLRKFR